MRSALERHVLPVLAELDEVGTEDRADQDPRDKIMDAIKRAKDDAALRSDQGAPSRAAREALVAAHKLESDHLELQIGHLVGASPALAKKTGRKAVVRLGADPFGSEPWLNAVMAEAVRDNVALIRSIPARHFREIEQIVDEGVRSGSRASAIAKQISERFGVAQRRAELIAADQVGKFHSKLDQIRMTDLGVEEYIWRTSLDERVRPEHEKRDGKRFKMDDPPADGHPGEPVRCRCYREPVIPGLEDIEPRDLEPRARPLRPPARPPAIPSPFAPRALPALPAIDLPRTGVQPPAPLPPAPEIPRIEVPDIRIPEIDPDELRDRELERQREAMRVSVADLVWEPRSRLVVEAGDVVVLVDIEKLYASLAKDPKAFIGPGGEGEIGGRIPAALEFFEKSRREGIAVHMPQMYLKPTGEAGFVDGRHRTEALRRTGAKTVPVTVSAEEAEEFRRRFGATQ
jgi:SPP1 gp7 family putative phage head morphogenesis protein